MAYDYSQSGWSPEVVDYATRLAAQRDALVGKYAGQNTGLDRPDFLTPMQVQQPASDEIKTEYLPEDVVRAFMAKYPTISETAFNPGVDIISYGASRDPAVYDVVRVPYGGDYTYTDKAAGKSGALSTPEELGAFARSRNLATGRGNNVANWEITDPSGKRLASDLPYTPSLLKQTGQTISDLLVEYGPSILAIPMTGGMSLGALMATAGGTAALGKLLKTGDLEKSIISGLTSAATAGALKVSGASDFLGKKLGEYGISMPTGASTAPSFAGPSSTAFSGVDLSSTLPGFAAGTSFGGPIAGAPGVEAVQVSGGGSFYPGGNIASGLIPAAFTGSTNSPSYADQPGVEEVRQTADRLNGGPAYGTPASLFNLYNPQTGPAPSESVTVSDKKLKDTTIDPESGLPHVPFTIPDYSYAMEPMDTPYQPPEDSTLDKYLRYASLGLTGASLLGGLVGGGGGGKGAGTYTGTGGKRPENFTTDTLPTGADIPAYGGGTKRRPKDVSGVDFNTYGFRPGINFFENEPTPPKAAAKGGAMAVKRPSKSFAVQGAGDGRSDDIPAVLSDGEYVIDAETVALLGNGSNKAGAAQLDRFRANVRKHKGKELAKGRFSVNAKNPQAYMAGGRS